MKGQPRVTDIRAKFPSIIAEDPAMIEVLKQTAKFAESEIDVLLIGESGVGKELLAEGIHRLSRRASGPFVPVNIAAVSETLMAADLFGHEKGAFTGANERHPGRFEQAHRGTLFLDEIGHLHVQIQPILLRALENKPFHRVGGKGLIRADVRVIAATDKDLRELVKAGTFLDALLYRFKARIAVPPLRQRPADIPALVRHFLKEYNRIHPKTLLKVSPGAMLYLKQHPLPGNVRQLLSALQVAVILSESKRRVLEVDDFKHSLAEWEDWPRSQASGDRLSELDHLTLDQVCELLIKRRLEIHKGNKTKAAQSLGVSRATFRAWCKKSGLEKKEASQRPTRRGRPTHRPPP